MDWAAEGLLDGLHEEEARRARAELLDRLHDDGVPLDELRRAVREQRLALLPVERTLMGPSQYTARQLAEAAGTTVDVVEEFIRSIGLPVTDPDELAYGDDDLAAVRRYTAWDEAGIPREEIRAVSRVTSAGMGRIAEAVREVFGRAFLQAGDTELDVARRYAAMAEQLMPTLQEGLTYLLHVHLREFARQDALDVEGGIGETTEIAVGFADLVGFTRLGEELAETELGVIAEWLERSARERAEPPVRVVKSIGDAVMLVSRDAAPLAEVLLDLVQAAEADDAVPSLRAGLAFGPAVGRLGDWYGATVNLASRLTGRARPGAVLTTASVREDLEGGPYEWSFAGEKRLKGVSAPTPTFRLRRAAEA